MRIKLLKFEKKMIYNKTKMTPTKIKKFLTISNRILTWFAEKLDSESKQENPTSRGEDIETKSPP